MNKMPPDWGAFLFQKLLKINGLTLFISVLLGEIYIS